MNKLFRLYYDPEAAPGAAPVNTAPGTASTTIPLPEAANPQAPAAPAAAVTFAIPDAYKDKSYLKGVDSQDKLFAMLDGAQNLIGKRPAGIPAQDASQEEWDKFYEAAGRPKEAKEYVFDGADKADPKFLPKVQAAMHKAGLNSSQAKVVYTEVNNALMEMAKEQGINAQQQDTDFEALAAKTFGADRDKVLSTSKALLEKFVPADMKGELGKLSNENLIIMAGVLNNLSKTYIKEDGAPGSGPTTTGMTPADISNKARALMLDPAYSDPFKPNHAAVKKQVDDLYALLRK